MKSAVGILIVALLLGTAVPRSVDAGAYAARVKDRHTCPVVDPGLPPAVPPKPHAGGIVLPPGCLTVLIGGLAAARIGDMCACLNVVPAVIVTGSPTVLIGGLPAARVGDKTSHGGHIITGWPSVLIGVAPTPG